MIVAIKCDFSGGIGEPLRSIINDFNDIKWRTERVPEYLFAHTEFECTQDYHAPDRVFKIDYNIIRLVEVDTSRPWTILDYDGAEYIQYLDYNVIDKESNYCKLRKD